ncbi:MAG: tryptophan--tRNA ligase [Saprospiraceae bacterium]|nr:tryptophan--tRNA ligase [Saprospiraceae bacterium]
MKRVLSCIQPTGDLHYGNYFGAVQNWVKLQSSYETIYGVVDYHAMTMPYNPKKLRENTWELIYNLIALGIKPDNLFIQSLVPEHSELSWIFNNFASMGRVENMTQFKDKSQQSKSGKDGFISVGLFDYPVLQAADILIYKADFVPVGEDQRQHLELTREIAQRFNNQVGKEYFVLPETLFTETPKIRSTADPSRKMSKSAGEKHNISVFADEAVIRKRIKSAVTDAGDTKEGEMSSGVQNLFEMLKASGEMDTYNSLMSDYDSGQLKYSTLKEGVADALSKLSNAFNAKKAEITADKREVKYQIKNSSAAIRKIAQETIKEVKDLCGLINVKF